MLKELVLRHPEIPLQPQKRVDLFSSLAHAITNQQLSGRVADVIFNRVRDLFPRRGLRPELLLKIPQGKLRKAGLSWNKIKSMRDLAQRLMDKRIPANPQLFKLTDDVLIEKLSEVYGIGPWTVQMLLIFKLGRADIFPSSDLGVQKGFQKLLRRRMLPKAKHMDLHSQRWKPYRSLAAWYLWRLADEVIVKPVEGTPMWEVGGKH